eukprot:2148860-Amphidinium_carterae.3
MSGKRRHQNSQLWLLALATNVCIGVQAARPIAVSGRGQSLNEGSNSAHTRLQDENPVHGDLTRDVLATVEGKLQELRKSGH